MTTQANDRQVGGNHYGYDLHDGGEQHWDRVHRLALDYFQGQITKYVERAWLKNGVSDLEKAQHFIEKYIELSRASGRLGDAEPRGPYRGQPDAEAGSAYVDQDR